MQPHKLDLQPCTQPARGEARVQLIRRKIESEKVLRTTLELTLAQLLREQRALLFSSAPQPRSSSVDLETSSTPSLSQPTRPRASPAAELPTESLLTMSPNTRRRRDEDEVKLKRKRRRISNKLINLDYMLKKRSLEQRAASVNLERSQKRPRPSEVIATAPINSDHAPARPEADQCPSVGSTSPREYHDGGSVSSEWVCSPPLSSLPAAATTTAPTPTWLSFAESSSSIWADPVHFPVPRHLPSEHAPLTCETDQCLQDVIQALAYEEQSSSSAVTASEDQADDCLAFLESVLLGSGDGGFDEAMAGHDAILSEDYEFDLSRFLDSSSLLTV